MNNFILIAIRIGAGMLLRVGIPLTFASTFLWWILLRGLH